MRDRILIGTVQAGVISSCNSGQTWQRLTDSENIPNISSFHFMPGVFFYHPAGQLDAQRARRVAWQLGVVSNYLAEGH